MNLRKQILCLESLIPFIQRESRRAEIDSCLLLSLAILEDINRPFWIRILENFLFRIGFYKPKTFGLMQVSSEKPIDDEESIRRAALLIKNIARKSKSIQEIGIKYNGSTEYGICLSFIYNKLKKLGE